MTTTSLQLPRACSHCELPAVVHMTFPGDGHSRFLCPTHVIAEDNRLGRRAVAIDEAVVTYPEPCPMGLGCPELDDPAHAAALSHPRVVSAADDDMADWEPCQGVGYPDGYYSGPYPCEDLAEPGEELCVHCRNRR